MNPYIILFIAVILEIIATSSLKLSEGFTRLFPTLVVFAGYGSAFYLMSLTLRTLPVGIVYAIWSGLGIVGIALIGIVFFGESFGLWHFIGTGLIIAGIMILSIISATAH